MGVSRKKTLRFGGLVQCFFFPLANGNFPLAEIRAEPGRRRVGLRAGWDERRRRKSRGEKGRRKEKKRRKREKEKEEKERKEGEM